MLELSDVSVSIKRTNILQHVALHVPNGSIVGLIGRNGAGKTTLMRTVMGFLPINEGEVRFQDQSLTRLTAHKRAHVGIGYMPEDRKLVPTLTVEENILLSFWATKNNKLPKRLPWVYEMIPEVTEFSGRKNWSPWPAHCFAEQNSYCWTNRSRGLRLRWHSGWQRSLPTSKSTDHQCCCRNRTMSTHRNCSTVST